MKLSAASRDATACTRSTDEKEGEKDAPLQLSGRGEGRGRTRQALARHVDLAPGTNGTVPAPDGSAAPAAPPLHAAAPRGRGIGDGLRARQLPAAAIVRAIWAASSVSSGWPQIDSTES